MDNRKIREILTRLVRQSDNPWLTGVCCINIDQNVTAAQIAAIFETVAELRGEYERDEAMVGSGL